MPWPPAFAELGGSDSDGEDSPLDATCVDESPGDRPLKRTRGPTPGPTPNELVEERLLAFGLDGIDNTADGNCFWHV